MVPIASDSPIKVAKPRAIDTRTTRSPNTSSTRDYSNFPPEFYDRLTTIHLTARALREHNRRNRLLPSPKREPPRSLYPGDIKRFARQGGPDLTDIIGVSGLFWLYSGLIIHRVLDIPTTLVLGFRHHELSRHESGGPE